MEKFSLSKLISDDLVETLRCIVSLQEDLRSEDYKKITRLQRHDSKLIFQN